MNLTQGEALWALPDSLPDIRDENPIDIAEVRTEQGKLYLLVGIHLFNLDKRTPTLQTQSNPSISGTTHLELFVCHSRRESAFAFAVAFPVVIPAGDLFLSRESYASIAPEYTAMPATASTPIASSASTSPRSLIPPATINCRAVQARRMAATSIGNPCIVPSVSTCV
jgi:hypothetical protein